MPDIIQDTISSRFPKFGTNKSREISRLVFEIAKREKISPANILDSIAETSYEAVKNTLLKRRYPENFGKVPLNYFYLPKYEPAKKNKADITTNSYFYPKNVRYTKDAADSGLLANAIKLFPNAQFSEIESLKSFLKGKNFSSADYNTRTENLFIIQEKYDFFKKCPCTSGVVNCGYSIINLGMGCPYECSYCFLQGYQNIPGIVLPYNISDYLTTEKITPHTKGFFNSKRTGSGEFTDSLVFDHITNFSKPITDFFKKHPDILFEFKTKSVNIGNLLESGGTPNIVAAWSVNSKKINLETEHKTSSMKERLEAAKQCVQAGFSTAFHFDPIVIYENWENDYKEAIDMIFDTVPNDKIKWISLGTLRMPATLKTIIETRFPENEILNGELLLGKDYKLRYAPEKRIEVFNFMNKIIKSKKSAATVYLCMEETEIWKKSGLI